MFAELFRQLLAVVVVGSSHTTNVISRTTTSLTIILYTLLRTRTVKVHYLCKDLKLRSRFKVLQGTHSLPQLHCFNNKILIQTYCTLLTIFTTFRSSYDRILHPASLARSVAVTELALTDASGYRVI